MDENKLKPGEIAEQMFGDIIDLRKQIKDCMTKIQIYGNQIESQGIDYRQIKNNKRIKESHIEFLLVKIEELEEEIENTKIMLDKAIIDANVLLEKLPDVNHQQVLTLVYVQGVSMTKAAEVMSFSLSHIKSLHSSALRKLLLIENNPK